MDFEKVLEELRKSLLSLVNDQYSDLKDEGQKAVEVFIAATKDKLEKWTRLLANGEISLEEYEWLLKSQKDLFVMQSLYSTGVSKIRIGRFKNKVINTIVDVVCKLVL